MRFVPKLHYILINGQQFVSYKSLQTITDLYSSLMYRHGLPLTILTATTVVGSVYLMPYANARTTTPNAP